MIHRISIAAFLALSGLLGYVSIRHPYLIGAENKFLNSFIDQQLLSILGVIVTITLASAASLHLQLNEMQYHTGEKFHEARQSNKRYVYLLITLFASAFILILLKSLNFWTDVGFSTLNALCILIFVLNLMALLDLSIAIFALPPPPRS